MTLLCCVSAEEKRKKFSLSDGEKILMTYNAEYVPSPLAGAPWFGRSGFIHPVYTPGGRVVTDGFPSDHPHQHGLMFAWTSSTYQGKGVDFWNSKKRQGKVEHMETKHADPNTIEVRLRHVIHRGEKPLKVLEETWIMNRISHDTMHVFDLISTQVCVAPSPLVIEKYKYGGMCVRGPENWNSGDVMLTNEGKRQLDGNHTRPHWVTMFGKVDGAVCGIAAMSHPENFNAPQPVRMHPKFPYFCFAPMVVGSFKIEPGKSYISRFRFVAFDGKPNSEQLNILWKGFTEEATKSQIK